MSNKLVTHEWLLVSTSIPYGQNTKGHMVIEGVGLDSDYGDCHRTQFAWGFEEDKLVKGKAVVTASTLVSRPISIINDNGKTAFKIPGGEGAHAIVSYVWVGDEYDDIKGWTVKGLNSTRLSGTFLETELEVIQTYNSVNEEVPVGVPIPWVTGTIPKGFLPYTGNGFDVERFPKLGELYPNGVLPNLTGDVLRAAEVGRIIMSKQGQSVQPLGFAGDPHTHSVLTYAGKWGRGSGSEFWASNATKTTGAATAGGKITGTGTETRMANTAVLYMTKAG